MDSCKNCKYFAQDEMSERDKTGRCYANPPSVMLIPVPANKLLNNPNGGLILQSVFPAVQEDGICRFYQKEGELR